MSSVFEGILSFERDKQEPHLIDSTHGTQENGRYDDWLLARKVKIPMVDDWNEGELGDSCCFGVRTVEFNRGCVWKLHGGV